MDKAVVFDNTAHAAGRREWRAGPWWREGKRARWMVELVDWTKELVGTSVFGPMRKNKAVQLALLLNSLEKQRESEYAEATAQLTEFHDALYEASDAADDIYDQHIPVTKWAERMWFLNRDIINPVIYPWGMCTGCEAKVATSFDTLCDACRGGRLV